MKKSINSVYNNHLFIFFIFSLVIFVTVKILLLPLSHHPFDFWAFINQSQRYYIFNVDLFEQLNKGVAIPILYATTYFIYAHIRDLIQAFSINNILMLNFITKIPFLFLDIISLVMVYKIMLFFKVNKRLALVGSLIYFTNPVIYYVYGIHGHYETIAVFLLLSSIILLISKRFYTASIPIALLFSIKYISIIYIPLILLYIFVNSKKKKINTATFGVLFLLFTSLFFFNIFINKDNGIKTIQNAFNLSASSSASISDKDDIKLNPLNSFSTIYFLNTNKTLSYSQNQVLYKLADKGLYISLILVLSYILYKAWLIYKDKSYDNYDLILDLLVITILFFINLSNFQGHYITWILTTLVIILILNRKYIPTYALLTVSSYIYLVSSELGSITPYLWIEGNPLNVFNSQNIKTASGSMVIISLFIILIIAIFDKNRNKIININLTEIKRLLKIHVFLWTIIIIQAISSTKYLSLHDENVNELFYAKKNNYIPGQFHDTFTTTNSEKYPNKLMFSNTGQLNTNIVDYAIRDPTIYRTFISIKNNDNKENISIVTLNDCLPISNKPIDQTKNKIKNIYIPSSYHILYEYDSNCLKRDDNIATYNAEYNANIDVSSVILELFITNTRQVSVFN